MAKTTERRAVLALLIILTVGITAAALFTACGKPEGKSQKAAGAGGEPPAESAEKSATRLSVGLDAGYGTDTFVQGMPFVFVVTLRNLSAEEAAQLSQKIAHYTKTAPEKERDMAEESLKLWRAELERIPDRPLKFQHDSKCLSEWISFEKLNGGETAPLPWPIEPANSSPEKRLELAEKRIHLEFILPDAASRNVEPGEYTIRAVLSGELLSSFPGKVLYRPAAFRVLSAEEAGADDIRQNARVAGEFYLNQKDYGRAEKYAREILNKDAGNIRALIIMGGVYEGRGDPEKAARTYQEAMNLFAERHPNDPPPPILLEKIQAYLWGKIKQEK
jgi:tetratricopeptide (TPR) repeat protein